MTGDWLNSRKLLRKKIEIELLIFLFNLHVGSNDTVGHVDVGEDVCEEAEGPGRLRYDQEVDDCVKDPGASEQSVKSRCELLWREVPAQLLHLKHNRAVL